MKGLAIVLAVLAVVTGLCILSVRCSGPVRDENVEYVRRELEAGKKEYRTLKVEELSTLARDLRVMARRYVEQGEKKKAQRAIGAAQELDKKIQELRAANEDGKPGR